MCSAAARTACSIPPTIPADENVSGVRPNWGHGVRSLLGYGGSGLEAWPDVLVRLTRAPFVSIALIRGRATGNGSELVLACDMSFASRETVLLSQWEVGVGL